MAAPDYLTWDGSVALNEAPRRPSTDDLGRDDLEDDLEEPPNETTDPTAAGWNQRSKQIAAISKTTDTIRISVGFSSGAPFVSKIATPQSTLVTGDLTVVDNATGDTTITWAANTLPAALVEPHGATLNTAHGSIWAEAVANGVRVHTANLAGSATDLPFTVCIG